MRSPESKAVQLSLVGHCKTLLSANPDRDRRNVVCQPDMRIWLPESDVEVFNRAWQNAQQSRVSLVVVPPEYVVGVSLIAGQMDPRSTLRLEPVLQD